MSNTNTLYTIILTMSIVLYIVSVINVFVAMYEKKKKDK